MTAWSALYIFGNMNSKQKDGLRVLILGASGGVGTLATQILKSQNSVVGINLKFLFILFLKGLYHTVL